jgi:chromosome segregation protein
MLKALEVQGFKSFADKTRFEFPPGITVVVGPNGSGKSNVVDAIKWVLGEQSAKSLRGKDMADVIFKGSGSSASGRKPMNFAEATIVFDNDDRKLPVDAPEVHVTRRVYRSGEGEYLINGESCRLKDIKDLFRGTGVSVDAYSIIEQGKVDKMLQASPKDRRAMFEEAAGISRFKAKKVEAQRRLERVDQNLLRLRDIVEEVDSRLKSVRNQAGKARRYREYSERLQLLRTITAWSDWQKLQARQSELQGELHQFQQQLESGSAEMEKAEADILAWETSLISAQEQLRNAESRLSQTREQISAREGAADFERARIRDLEEEIVRRRQQMSAMTTKVVDVRTRLRDLDADLASAEAEHENVRAKVADFERQSTEIAAQQQRLRGELETQRRTYTQAMRQSADLGNRASTAANHRETALIAMEQCAAELATVNAALDNFQQQLAALQAVESEYAAHLATKRTALEGEQLELDKNRLLLSERLDDLSHLRGRHRGAEQRRELLADLEARREGLEAGVKDLLDSARLRSELGIRGLVADVISAQPEWAQIIDLALGDLSQAIVVEGEAARERVLSGQVETKGRVLFVGLCGEADSSRTGWRPMPRETGIVDRADRLATAMPGFEPLLEQLLGRTWLVETLADAVRLRSAGATDCRFIARSGQRLEADGTVIIGGSRGAAGLISRRSELRHLLSDIAVFQRQIEEAEAEAAQVRVNIATREAAVRRLSDEHRQAADELADRQVAVRAHQQRGDQLTQQQTTFDNQQQSLATQAAAAEAEIKRLREEQAQADETAQQSEAAVASIEARLAEREQARLQLEREALATRVELARCEQRVDALRLQRFQCEEDEKERDRLLSECRGQLREGQSRRETAELHILEATSDLAELYLAKESLAGLIAERWLECETLSADRARVNEEVQGLRRSVRKLEEDVHARQLAANEARHELQSLLDKMREDYNIDLAAITEPPGVDERPRAEIEEEIASLRKKINSVGAVNLDALDEIDDLEARHKHLSEQYEDLSQAKNSLEKIIHKINADSRRIFLETLEAIRTNFQALYRRAFGGGKADLALEEGVDVLESGVDIVATPPGKPSFSNSLLSGGEKALTAVALLLGIFQFRPSPFCVLDEVDAPFDEANIGRFVEVLKDFLGWTRFIVVTHSKKTMTSANTLYGVTMQESGVSKRVSVRFDDVSEDGRISSAAVERESARERDDAKGVA